MALLHSQKHFQSKISFRRHRPISTILTKRTTRKTGPDSGRHPQRHFVPETSAVMSETLSSNLCRSSTERQVRIRREFDHPDEEQGRDQRRRLRGLVLHQPQLSNGLHVQK